MIINHEISYDTGCISDLDKEKFSIVCPFPEAEEVLRNMVDDNYLKYHINSTFERYFDEIIRCDDFSSVLLENKNFDWDYYRSCIGYKEYILFKYELDHIISEDVIKYYLRNRSSLTPEQEQQLLRLLLICSKNDILIRWYTTNQIRNIESCINKLSCMISEEESFSTEDCKYLKARLEYIISKFFTSE